ncbi:MAG: DUF2927 domain-containing protein [Bacteroidota bacterium]|nr:DUF2927 domain-containing protein [Bacteroidota bacterium]
MKKYLTLFLIIVACSGDSESLGDDQDSGGEDNQINLTQYQIDVINYFKDIALGFEFGTASAITRKWKSPLNIFVGGKDSPALNQELIRIKDEINNLAKDGFKISIVNDSIASNYYIFFGSGQEYAQIYPNLANYVANNWGLFNIYWSSDNVLNYGHMYVDTQRANPQEQMHLLREELTQSLGLGKDSEKYPNSIFQSSWTQTTEYLPIDRELIRLLYHPEMKIGLNDIAVEELLIEILQNE